MYSFIFGCAGSLLLCKLFSSCDEWRLVSCVVAAGCWIMGLRACEPNCIDGGCQRATGLESTSIMVGPGPCGWLCGPEAVG